MMTMKRQPIDDSIAIIGMACVFPGAHSPEELWQNVLAGRRFFRKTPAERWPLEDYFDRNPKIRFKTYCDKMAVITGWRFDPLEFRVPPVTVGVSDLTHWLALSTAHAALQDAGLDLERIDRERVGVILGNSLSGEFCRSNFLTCRWPYAERALRHAMEHNGYDKKQIDSLAAAAKYFYEAPLPDINEDSLAGNLSNVIAGRICNYFDFGGGGYTVDAACASSLLAAAHACTALLNGEMDITLAGGVDISLDPFELVGFSKTFALTNDDIRPYDERANGMLPGEGCGILVLARESLARAAGYHIHALIRGWGYASDGSGNITRPEIKGLVRTFQRTYEQAGYPISTVALIEGHGTGTAAGDKIEISALLHFLNECPAETVCRIGSIKGNIGHCKAAAGAAGLIKAVMALKRKIFPPSGNCERFNPEFGKPLGRLRPNIRAEAWESNGKPRRTSVNAMGFGGINCHIALEEANPNDLLCQSDLALSGSGQTSELLLLSAHSRQELWERVDHLIPMVERISQAEMTDMAAALAQQYRKGGIRLALVADSPWNLAKSLKLVSKKLSQKLKIEELDEPTNGIFAGNPRRNSFFAALFPGQGCQRLNMGEYLLRRYPFIRDLYREAETAVAGIIPGGLENRIMRNLDLAAPAEKQEWETQLGDTLIAQPAIVLTSVVLLQVLKYFGLIPGISLGHSLGEISALCAAGACDEITAVRIAALRGKAMASLCQKDLGAMVALTLHPDYVKKLIEPFGPSLIISNYNSPRQTVVSGESPAIRELVLTCQRKEIRCRRIPTSHGFHSRIVSPAAAVFHRDLQKESFKPLSGRMISTAVPGEITGNIDFRTLLSEHIRRPVRFEEAVQQARKNSPALWIEIGPSGVLTNLLYDIYAPDSVECLPTDLEGVDGFHLLNNIFARAYVLGLPLALDKLFEHRFHRPFSLEKYDPGFIVNPCERKIEPLNGRPIPTEANPGSGDQDPNSQEKKDSILEFSVDWIARRTGFPASAIESDMKLGEHLKMDSIKVTQLVLELSRKLGHKVPLDFLGLANSTLQGLVHSILHAGFKERDSQDMIKYARGDLISQYGDLLKWVRTFGTESIHVPLEAEQPLSLPRGERFFIISEPGCKRARAIAHLLEIEGLTTFVTDAETLINSGQYSADLYGLLILLPGTEQAFFQCLPAEFHRRVMGYLTTLFELLRWVNQGEKEALWNIHCMVIRPWSFPTDTGIDLDAGAAFLKSLRFEYPGLVVKWLRLPLAWSPHQWAETALRELQTSGEYVFYGYDKDGRRTTEAAVPLTPSPETSPDLTGSDVVLASGGAKGITFELAAELARQMKVKLALLGSSPLPGPHENPQTNEILRNFHRLEQEGIRYMYVSCDITHQESLQKTVKEVENKLGKVTVILHGAGINQPQLFLLMELSSFLQCIKVKALGLYNLLTAVPLSQLKALHLLSSVLGKTGIRGQVDYTTANAWLNHALRSIQTAYPRLHCLSLGYTNWAETGMSLKQGFNDFLLSVGITPLGTRQGVSAYLDLVRQPQVGSAFFITGMLTPELEATLFPPPPRSRGRFLERILFWAPGTMIVADASLSFTVDLYLADHVFEGTPVFPGIMAVEAMVEAAMICVNRSDLPVLKNIFFHHALIIPEAKNTGTDIRIIGLAEPPKDGTTQVKVMIRSDLDNFQQNYFELQCFFVEPSSSQEVHPPCPLLSEPLKIDPHLFHPLPLFQGKFFRHITSIHKLDMRKESITKVKILHQLLYFNRQQEDILVIPFPAAIDTFFQAAAIILPQISLPVKVEELCFHQGAIWGSEFTCQVQVTSISGSQVITDILVFNGAGELAEIMKSVIFKAVSEGNPAYTSLKSASIPFHLVASKDNFPDLLPWIPQALALISYGDLKDLKGLKEILPVDIEFICSHVPLSRQGVMLANLAAARRAFRAFACRQLNREISPAEISLDYQDGENPGLRLGDEDIRQAFPGIDFSLAHAGGISAALVGPAPLGVDMKIVKKRSGKAWLALLGDHGFIHTYHISAQTKISFEQAAAYLWSMSESGKKVNFPGKPTPLFQGQKGHHWYSFRAQEEKRSLDFFCSTLEMPSSSSEGVVLSVAVGETGIGS